MSQEKQKKLKATEKKDTKSTQPPSSTSAAADGQQFLGVAVFGGH